MDEILDIVDDHDHVIDQKYRSDVYKEKLKNFRVINAFLVNDKKEIWIPKRSPHKKLFPLCWDASVGGHVSAGESYDEAFIKELKEELNLDAMKVHSTCIGKLTPQTHDVSAFMQLYVITTNIDPDYNKNDFIEAHWFSLEEIQEKLYQGEPAKGDLPLLLAFLKSYL